MNFNLISDTENGYDYQTRFREQISIDPNSNVYLNFAQLTKLNTGDSFLIIDGKLIVKEKEIKTTPSWLNNESQFKSLPYKEVLAEEREALQK